MFLPPQPRLGRAFGAVAPLPPDPALCHYPVHWQEALALSSRQSELSSDCNKLQLLLGHLKPLAFQRESNLGRIAHSSFSGQISFSVVGLSMNASKAKAHGAFIIFRQEIIFGKSIGRSFQQGKPQSKAAPVTAANLSAAAAPRASVPAAGVESRVHCSVIICRQDMFLVDY